MAIGRAELGFRQGAVVIDVGIDSIDDVPALDGIHPQRELTGVVALLLLPLPQAPCSVSIAMNVDSSKPIISLQFHVQFFSP